MAPNQEEDDSSMLVLLLETHQQLWSQLQADAGAGGTAHLTLSGFLQQVLVFINAYLALNEANQLAVLAVSADRSHFLYASPALQGASASSARPGGMHANASEEVLQNLKPLLAQQAAGQGGTAHRPAVVAGALSRGLCLINKAQSRAPAGSRKGPQPRMLVLQGSPDATEQYIATMNAIFAAQRSEVCIDACMLGRTDSTFLQQAAHLTGGVYLRPKHRGALLQYLLTVYSGDGFSRGFLELPQQVGVDFRASCFCHRRAIDLGFVCSVCLSIFCENLPVCSTCGTEFKAGRGSAAKRKAAAVVGEGVSAA